jgi:antitoxin MazE
MTKVQKWGNSLAVRIPQSIAGQIAVSEGIAVELCVPDGELIVRPCRRVKVSLDELLKNCPSATLHSETDFGVDVGKEAIDSSDGNAGVVLSDHLRGVDWKASNTQFIHRVTDSELAEVVARIEALLVTPDV